MIIKEYFSVKNDCYKANINKEDSRYVNFQKNGPKGLMLHSVGCPQPSALVFAKEWNNPRPFNTKVAVHGVLQADGLVYQCLPWNFRGWHSNSGEKGALHNTHIGIEMTEPDCLKYEKNSSKFTCSNLEKAQEQVKGTYKTAVELFAYLCKKFNLDPLKDGVILSHREAYLRGMASNHGDPEHLWTQLKLPYTMNGFRKDVKNAMGGTTETTTPTTTTDKSSNAVYKVQAGAYKVLKNAQNQEEKLKKAGFNTIIVKEDEYYKVQVGAYTVKSNADSAVKKLKEKGFTACIKTVKTEKETVKFKVGDKVKVNKNAKVYGKDYGFQNWVYNSTLYVREINGDKITISTQKTGAITGVVNINDLTKV